MYASYNGHLRLAKLLLESGAEIDMQAVDGLNPLWSHPRTVIMKLLNFSDKRSKFQYEGF